MKYTFALASNGINICIEFHENSSQQFRSHYTAKYAVHKSSARQRHNPWLKAATNVQKRPMSL
jgi:hypothetical protein